MERQGKNEDIVADDEPLIVEDEGNAIHEEEISLRIQPKRTIIVEPLAVLYVLAGMPLMSLKSQYMYQKISWDLGINLNNLSVNGSNECDLNKSDPGHLAREHVQAVSSQWNIYISLVNYLPAVIMTFIYGSYSDTIGRRLSLISPVIGSISTILVQMCIVYFDLPVWCFLFGVVEYLFGGFYTLITGAFAYLADTVPEEKRAMRMAILDAVMLGTAAVGNVTVGYLIHVMGYFIPYIFCLVGKLVTLMYVLFFVPETVRKTPNESAKTFRQILKNIKNGIKLHIVDNGTGRCMKINLLLTYLIADLISTSSIMTLFELNTPLCWNSVLIGYFGAASDVIRCIAMVVAAFVLKRWFSEKWLAVLGLFSCVCYDVYIAFVVSTLMMFFSPLLGCLTFLYIPMIRALMSKLVNLDEQGSLFSVMMVVGYTATLISTLTSNKIYAATLLVMEGFIFLVGAGTKVIALVVLGIYIYKCRTRETPKIHSNCVERNSNGLIN